VVTRAERENEREREKEREERDRDRERNTEGGGRGGVAERQRCKAPFSLCIERVLPTESTDGAFPATYCDREIN
jgi:hypothetical protein